MAVTLRSYSKINLGLLIGARRDDGFHELRTVYQTLALHDRVTVRLGRGSGIAIECSHPKVPRDGTNTCHRMAQRMMDALKGKGRVTIEIDKRLPVEGGLAGGSANAVATMLGIELELGRALPPSEKLRIACEIGSDVPLFLVAGTVLGLGRGEEVYPLDDLPQLPVVLATPAVGVSTPKAFADWDEYIAGGSKAASKLTISEHLATMNKFSRTVAGWLIGSPTGVPSRAGDRAEALLLDLVRTGIENDFEAVVFPQYPELRTVKQAVVRAGARYASLSGSGSTVYGLFRTRQAAQKAAAALRQQGIPATATSTISRREYWYGMAEE